MGARVIVIISLSILYVNLEPSLLRLSCAAESHVRRTLLWIMPK